MKRELLRILCCPACRGDLALSVEKQDVKDIIEGTLRCAGCGKGYPIKDGIPDLLPPG